MQDKRLIVKGIYIYYLHLFINLLLTFIMTPIIVGHLGKSAYGLWAVFGSVMGYFGLLKFGLGTATTKYTAEYRARNDLEALSKLISSVSMVFIVVGIIIVFTCIGLTPFLPSFLQIPKDLLSAGRVTFITMGFSLALGLFASVFGSMIYGYQRVDVWRTFSIIQAIVNALFILLFFRLGFGLVGIAFASFLSVFLLLTLYLIFINHHSNYKIVLHPRLADLKTIKRIAPYSLRSFILILSALILYQTDSLVIGIFLGVSFVTSYAIAYQLCFYSTYLFSLITETVFPTFTRLYTLNDIDRLRSLYLRILKISVAIVVPIAIALGIFGHSFINLWVGEKNSVGIDVLLVLVVMNFFHAFGTPAGLLLQAIGENRKFMYSEIVNALLNLLLSVILVKKIGVLGVALGTLVAHLCTSFWVMPLLVFKYTKISIRQYISSILPPLLVGIPVALLVWIFIKDLFPSNHLHYLGLKVVMLLAIYSSMYLIFGSTQEERRMYLRLFSKELTS
jgi:O-antigen/teichoic acid export membrane protein